MRALHRGRRLIAIGGRLLERLAAGEVALGERELAHQLGVGARRRGLRRDELRLGLLDLRLRRRDLLADAGDGGTLRLDLAARGVERETIITIIYVRDDVARMHEAVVRDVDRGDVAADLGGERGRIGANVSIVG